MGKPCKHLFAPTQGKVKPGNGGLIVELLIYIELALFLAFGYVNLRVDVSYRALKKLGRPSCLPPLEVMALSPARQLRWTARQWDRWAAGRLVIL